MLLLCLLLTSGCTRKFFRERADRAVDQVLSQKDQYSQWKIENEHVYPDPRARFADPTNPDRPPKPPDDPAAFELSPNPQKPGKAGIAWIEGTGYLDLLAAWDAQNRAEDHAAGLHSVMEPTSAKHEAQTGTPPDCPLPARPFRIRLEQAAELGLINSREYQDRREDLYLAALPVTLQRFAFAPQFFATGQAIREWSGRETPEGQHNRWLLNSNIGLTKVFSTGALLLFSIANQTVIELTNPREVISQSMLTLDLMQPLLRGGGFAVTLEPLTQTERNLLYEIRSYARFRKEFFTSIAAGTPITPNAVPPGTFSTGFIPGIPRSIIGITTNTFPVQVPAGVSGVFTITPAVPFLPAGYLPTLLPAAQLVIDQSNVRQLRGLKRLFEAFKEGGDVSQLQVDQVEQQLLQGESQVLQDELSYGNLLDQLKVQLGLPVNTSLELDDAPVQALQAQYQNYDTLFAEFDDARNRAAATGGETPAKMRDHLRELFTTAPLVHGTPFRERLPRLWAAWEAMGNAELAARLRELAEERRHLLDSRAEAEQRGERPAAAGQQRLATIEFEIDLGTFERDLRDYEAEPWKLQPDPERRQRQRSGRFRLIVNDFTLVMGEARSERLEQLRNGWPELPRACVDGMNLLTVEEEEAQAKVAQTALLNRLDIMNERARVVDAWRQIAVFANALLGTLNVEYRLDSFTPIGQAKPLDFGGSRNRHQLIVNGELPLVRVAERNDYRAALIAYQRQRRSFMETEDLTVGQVRAELRQLRVLAENYRIQQRQVELAYLTFESSLDTFRAPPAPVPPGTAVNTAATAASLTQQLLTAQRSLPVAQDALLAVWINYLTTRLQLYRDLELMQIDSRGVWIDEFTTCPNAPEPLGQPTPIASGAEIGTGSHSH